MTTEKQFEDKKNGFRLSFSFMFFFLGKTTQY